MEHEAKDQIGFVLDEFIFEERLSISANGRYFGSTYSKYDHSLFLQFCERFHLDPKQKTGRAFQRAEDPFPSLLSPSLIRQSSLIMDEPAAGLDPLFRRELTGYMQELVEDGTRSVLFSTHLTADLDQIGDYIAADR